MSRPNLAILRGRGAEARECGAYCEWFERFYPYEYLNLIHIPNERHERMTAIQLQLMGVKAGVSDYLLALRRGEFPGMWLEFKATGRPPSSVSMAQRDWLTRMATAGYFTAVAFGLDRAIAITRAYLAGLVTEEHWYRPGDGFTGRRRTRKGA